MQELQGEEHRKLLDAIDSLRGYGLARICTRFASEVVLRRHPNLSVSVSITPGSERTEAQKNTLKNFRRRISGYDDFPSIVTEAQKAMGLSDNDADFAHDILKVEVYGPKQPQLTLVDLPGLIQSSTDAQKEDQINVVYDIVKSYMRNPRSIILAIVSATDHYQNQGVLRTARDIDREGERTLGIITKPDKLTPHSEMEKLFRDLARNEPIKLKLGWHMVRNTDMDNSSETDDATAEGRQQREDEFFRNRDFKADTRVGLGIGIPDLRNRLSKLLFERVRDSIHPLLKDIEKGISQCKHEVAKLGDERSTVAAQIKFLSKLSGQFQKLSREAVRGDYGDVFFQVRQSSSARLCAVLRNSHDRFAHELLINGAKWNIASSSQPDIKSRLEAIQEAREILKNHRGRELPGVPNPDVIQRLFEKNSSPWKEMAKDHIRDCQHAIQTFVEEVLDELTDRSIRQKLQTHILDPALKDLLENALHELDKLAAVHERAPLTSNPRFMEKARALEGKRTRNEIADSLQAQYETRTQRPPSELISTVRNMTLASNTDPDELAAEEALDTMLLFYDVRHKS
ncbi:MAG: hypothetical protein Q9227_002098 [Pyrenula ochraceoflavens]